MDETYEPVCRRVWDAEQQARRAGGQEEELRKEERKVKAIKPSRAQTKEVFLKALTVSHPLPSIGSFVVMTLSSTATAAHARKPSLSRVRYLFVSFPPFSPSLLRVPSLTDVLQITPMFTSVQTSY